MDDTALINMVMMNNKISCYDSIYYHMYFTLYAAYSLSQSSINPLTAGVAYSRVFIFY